MKKNLVYAMMLVAAMSSCSKDSDAPATPNTPEEEGDVAITLSALPQGMVATRGYGMVGDVEGNQNVWASQVLYFYGVKKIDGKANFSDPNNIIIENLEATAAPANPLNPSATETISLFGETPQTVYYPRTGAYDFFGYHVNDAENITMKLYGTEQNPLPSDTDYPGITWNSTHIVASPFIINGTQDLMLGKAELTDDDYLALYNKANNTTVANLPVEADKAALAKSAYSAYSSRANITPAMQFNHLLSRLNFFVVGGGNNEDAKSDYVYIKSIKVSSKTTGLLVAAYENDADKGIKWAGTQPMDNVDDTKYKFLSVMEKTAIGNTATTDLQDLNGSSTFYETLVTNYTNLPEAGNANLGAYHSTWNVDKYEAKLVGAPILVQPNPDGEIYNIKIEVVQFYDKNGNKIPAPINTNNNFKKGLDQRYWEYELEVKASELKQKDELPDPIVNAFQPGHSYNVTLTVYSLQDIKVNVTLGAWIYGGEVSLNPDDIFE